MTASSREPGRESTPPGITACPPHSSFPRTTYAVLPHTTSPTSPVTKQVSRESTLPSNGADRRELQGHPSRRLVPLHPASTSYRPWPTARRSAAAPPAPRPPGKTTP